MGEQAIATRIANALHEKHGVQVSEQDSRTITADGTAPDYHTLCRVLRLLDEHRRPGKKGRPVHIGTEEQAPGLPKRSVLYYPDSGDALYFSHHDGPRVEIDSDNKEAVDRYTAIVQAYLLAAQ